jgi:glycosyltransferase involved in cell wall biosynthesis
MQPFLSIVIPNYNGGRFLEQCLSSVCSVKPDCVEVIVIDGGSTDNSLDVILAFESSLKFWKSEKDSGPADAISKGFSLARGQWLGWLNSDDFYLPGALNILVHQLRLCRVSASWLVACRLLASEEGLLVKHQSSMPTPDYIFLRDAYGVPQECTFFTRLLYDKVGGIDTRMKCHFDLDLFLRMYQIDRPCYSEYVLGCFRQRPTQISRNHQLSSHDYRLKIDSHYGSANIFVKILRKFLHSRFRNQTVALSKLLLHIELKAKSQYLSRIVYSKDAWVISYEQ